MGHAPFERLCIKDVIKNPHVVTMSQKQLGLNKSVNVITNYTTKHYRLSLGQICRYDPWTCTNSLWICHISHYAAGMNVYPFSSFTFADLRLYRERPQSGISSQWDVAVGPTATQWQAFISSLSRNEKEYDLYYFLQHELFELVKESLDVYELHAVNGELDTAYLRAKETNELAELRRVKGLSATKSDGPNADEVKFPLTTVTNLGSNGPKSASPAFSGGHGACGIGSASSSTSGAPLTPSSARTPTSAPPATTLLPNGYMAPSTTGSSAQASMESVESHGLGKTEANVFTTREFSNGFLSFLFGCLYQYPIQALTCPSFMQYKLSILIRP